MPVSKSSFAKVPPNGSFMCVWTSIPPGMTYLSVASIVSSTPTVPARFAPIWAMRSPSTRTSAAYEPPAVTTVPFAIRVRIGFLHAGSGARDSTT